MVRFTVLASGSKGNSSIVSSCPTRSDGRESTQCTRILVDAGLSCRELFRRMAIAGEDPRTLDAILITHEHQDHINGLAATARKLGIPVYFTEATHRAWVRQVTPQKRITYAQWVAQYKQGKEAMAGSADSVSTLGLEHSASHGPEVIANAGGDREFAPVDSETFGLETSERDPSKLDTSKPDPSQSDPVDFVDPESVSATPADPARLPAVNYFRAGEVFKIGDIAVSPFTIPHDAADPVGFVFSAEGVRLAVATDLGYLPPNVQSQLRRCDLILLESNHDLEMLRDGPYPWSVKQRVLSRVGHLSNDAASQFLEQTYDGHATHLVLGHLSESNNLPELALLAAERALISKPSLLANRLHLAGQHEPMPSICF
jgi:phosphoribosyl 1,2-cyclic phosphodiesterase